MAHVKFTGTFKELKSQGFKFCKLFADNYMQWSKYGVRVWKRGGDVTLDNYNLYMLIKFFQGNPKVSVGEYSLGFYKIKNDDGSFYYAPADEETIQLYITRRNEIHQMLKDDISSEFWPTSHESVFIDLETMETLKAMKELKWFELVD